MKQGTKGNWTPLNPGAVKSLLASHGLSEKYLQKGPVSARKNLAQVLFGQKPIVIQDVAADKRVQYRKMKQEEGIVTILSVPVKTKEQMIGVLRLYGAVARKFTPDEIKLVTALAYLAVWPSKTLPYTC